MRDLVFRLAIVLLLAVHLNLGASDLVTPPKEGKQYETLRFRFSENLLFENPFDLETNQVELQIRQPDFFTRVLSFFYDGTNESGVQNWEARFAPKQAGLHRLAVVVNGTVRQQFELSVKPNDGKKQGGLKLSDRLGVFEYESGEAFRGIGLNVCWANDYEYYFKKMQAAGINITRIWMCPWNLSFEWQETGLGRYNLETCKRLDEILALAEKYGIFIILCMDYHGIARKGLGYFRENRWLVNPYNKINGGPCVEGADLFTSAEAKEHFKRKYKYVVSRFGHSSKLATWEFYNEADLMAGKSIPVNRWHVEMAEYVHSIDAHDRLISTSGTRDFPEKLVDAFKSPAMDYVMYHRYNALNMAPYVTDLHEAVIEYYQKPFVLGEFGVEFRGGDRTYKLDPQAIGLHNAIWAGWFSETPVIPLSWWWDNYIDPHDFWSEFANLSRFAEAMNYDQQHLTFRTLTAGTSGSNPAEQSACLVRAFYSGENCAVWIKNMGYQWAAISEGQQLEEIFAFTQIVPGLASGNYSVVWFNPETGEFMGEKQKLTASSESTLSLSVPAFQKDLACVITRKK